MYTENILVDAANFADDEMQYANNGGVLRVQAVADKLENLGLCKHGETAVVEQALVYVSVYQGRVHMSDEREMVVAYILHPRLICDSEQQPGLLCIDLP